MTAVPASARTGRTSLEPLLRAKLSRPQPGDQILERSRLLRALGENSARPLTLLVADAGYGKTTLLAAFVRSLARPVVWYSLMPSDADPIVFGRYLLEGFRREHPRFGRDVERALEEGRPGGRLGEMLGGTIAGALAALKGPAHLLVLDDFQEVAGEPQVLALVDTLLRHLPERVRIVIASRTVPPLSLERMRVRGDVFELNSSQLRLTREEQGRLFSEVYGRALSVQELAELDETTLGWPTAVHLVHESLRRSDQVRLEEVLASFRASSLELHDYLSMPTSRPRWPGCATPARCSRGWRGAACCAPSASNRRLRTSSTTWCAASCARRSKVRAAPRRGGRSSGTRRARWSSAASRSGRCGTSCSPAASMMPRP